MSRVTCPSCGVVLKLADDLPLRKKVKCPECNTVFPVPDAEPDEPGARRRSDAGDDYDEEEDRQSRRPRRRRRQTQSVGNVAVLVGAGLLALVVIGGLFAGGIYAVIALNKKPEVAQNPLDQPGPDGRLPNQRPQWAPPGGVPPGGLPPGGPGLPPNMPPGGGGLPQPPDAGGQTGTGTEVGQMAKDIEGEDIDGKPFKLSDYRGKVVLLDFWGHW